MPKIKAQNLSDMKIEEVSLVGEGANPGARVVLFKSKDGKPKVKKNFGKELTDFIKLNLWGSGMNAPVTYKELYNSAEAQEMISVLNQSLQNIAGDPDLSKEEKDSLTEQSVNEFLAAMKSDTPEAGEDDSSTTGEVNMTKTIAKEMSLEEKAAAYDRLQAAGTQDAAAKSSLPAAQAPGAASANDHLPTNGGVAPDKKPAANASEPDGGLQIHIHKALEPIMKQMADLTEVVKGYKEKDADTARLTKATEICKGLAVDPTQIANLMKGMDDTQVKDLEQVLKASSAQSAAGNLFQVQGAPVAKAGSVDAALEARVAEIMKEDSSLTKPRAIAKALKESPTTFVKVSRNA